jgi:hypothetical protein
MPTRTLILDERALARTVTRMATEMDPIGLEPLSADHGVAIRMAVLYLLAGGSPDWAHAGGGGD